MTEHTPLPWKVCNEGECPCLTIGCPNHPIAKVQSGEWGDEYPAMRQVGASLENRYEAYMERIGYGTIDPETARANALLIVKAVNAHDVLVKALTESRTALIAFKDAVEASQKMNGREYVDLGIQVNNAIGHAWNALSLVGTVGSKEP